MFLSVSDMTLMEASARIKRSLETSAKCRDEWDRSPFAWIQTLPPATKGRIGAEMVSAWCQELGITVSASADSDADIVFNGRRVEMKMSMLWSNGTYRFQQLRDQAYEVVVCLGLSPHEIHCWVVPKAAALANARPQHLGANGTDTRWFSVSPSDPPDWLMPHGGTTERAATILSSL